VHYARLDGYLNEVMMFLRLIEAVIFGDSVTLNQRLLGFQPHYA